MNQEQQRIWEYLIREALGRNNAKHISEIANAIGVPHRGTNNDDVRGWIKDMVVNYQRPIGTCPDGAFIILTDDEREEAARFLERNSISTVVRRNGNYTP